MRKTKARTVHTITIMTFVNMFWTGDLGRLRHVFSLWTAVTLVKSPMDALTHIFERPDLEHSSSQSSPVEVFYQDTVNLTLS
jgi:hypothetical protein